MKNYLTIKAPFSGIITERNVHEGSIVAMESRSSGVPLVRIQECSPLRLLVAVPEAYSAQVTTGEVLSFEVPAYPGHKYRGTIARSAHILDRATLTMPIELDVSNDNLELQPGMFACVAWILKRPEESLFVPVSSLSSSSGASCVLRVRDNKAEKVIVRTGYPMGKYIEICGDIKPAEEVLLQAEQQSVAGSAKNFRDATEFEIEQANKRTSAASLERF